MEKDMLTGYTGVPLLVRCESSGTFTGILDKPEHFVGNTIRLTMAYGLWNWSGDGDFSDICSRGFRGDCSFSTAFKSIILTDVIAVAPLSDEAVKTLKKYSIYSKAD